MLPVGHGVILLFNPTWNSLSPPTLPLYTPITVEQINIDDNFWNTKIFPGLVDFYMKHMFPELMSPWHLSGQPIREHIPFDYTH